MELLDLFAQDAKKLNGTIIFAEGDEERTIQAAAKLKKDGILKPILVSNSKNSVTEAAQKTGADISGIEILQPDSSLLSVDAVNFVTARYEAKGLSQDEIKKNITDPLVFSALYVKSGKAGGCVAGARSSTADVLKAAIYGIGAKPGTKFISSFFIMIPPKDHPVAKSPIIYADCGVNPDPAAIGLKDIAMASVESFKCLFPGEKAIVSFLSFSTKGSAEHKMLDKIRQASADTAEYYAHNKDVVVDGEMQFDAAIIPAVAQKKCPGSPVAGKANIFIFPDLNAGNICYKVTERLGGFTALGPIIQGLDKPMCDLSRGCSPTDIYYVAIIALLKSKTDGLCQKNTN